MILALLKSVALVSALYKVATPFKDLPISPETAESLASHGYIDAFPIQEMVLPIALRGDDLIGQAKTGTGKTLGFGIPLIESVIAPLDEGWEFFNHQGQPQALVVVPTRELCIQVAKDLTEISTKRGIRFLAIYGGRPFEPQIEAIRAGVEVIVGTPGRLLDLFRQGHLTLKHISRVVLDEADEMLDLGFLPDVEKIFSQTPHRTQTMLFSATMPGEIISLARKFMNQPVHIRTQDSEDEGQVVNRIEQHVFRAHAMDKLEMLARILQAQGRGATIVFCRTKRTAQNAADDLVERGFTSVSLHGDMGQAARERALADFKKGKADILVATDVAARGIDIDGITHVINYQAPEDDKTYVHRIGRTARAGAHGIAVTFVDWDELPRWKAIDEALGLNLGEPQETYSSSEHLYAALNIPQGATGRINKALKKPTKKVETRPAKVAVAAPQGERIKRERKRTKRINAQ